MKGIKFISRKFIFPVLYRAGFDKILRSLSHNSNLSIMYHGVVERNSNYFSARHIEKSQFEKQILYLKNEFEIISLKEASDRKNERQIKSGKKSISISFDDGYLNNLQIALPILEKHKVNATFFISSICCESNGYILWSDLIAALHYFFKDTIIEVNYKKFKNLTSLSGDLNIYDYIKSLDYNKRDQIVNELCKQYYLYDRINSLPDEIWKIMNAKQLKEFSGSSNVEIGSHGFKHFNLDRIPINEASFELSHSKSELETIIEKDVNMIAYPDGAYSSDIKLLSQELGYKYQFAVNYKLNGDRSDGRILNRHGISSTTTFESNMLMMNHSFKNKGF